MSLKKFTDFMASGLQMVEPKSLYIDPTKLAAIEVIGEYRERKIRLYTVASSNSILVSFGSCDDQTALVYQTAQNIMEASKGE